jgi:NAD(P)-dependent dehydrogenase (short-subunit alcohol dehydrogenase family)
MVRESLGHTHPSLCTVLTCVVSPFPVTSSRPTVVSLYIKTDITSLPSVREASTKILKNFQGQHPSILVNNAGIGGGFGMLDCDVDKVKRVLDVNLTSHW